MLQITSGDSWAQYFSCTDDNGNPIGDDSYGAEFGITDLNSGLPYLVVTTAFNIVWQEPGTVIVNLTPLQTQIATTNAGWYLDLLLNGARIQAAFGTMSIAPPSPTLLSMQNNTVPTYTLAPALSLHAPFIG